MTVLVTLSLLTEYPTPTTERKRGWFSPWFPRETAWQMPGEKASPITKVARKQRAGEHGEERKPSRLYPATY